MEEGKNRKSEREEATLSWREASWILKEKIKR